MSSKWKNANQTELFDGKAVEKYQLGFKGTFSSEEVNADALGMDDHVCLLVIASVSDAGFKKDKEDEVIRVNKLEVLRAVELDPTIADYALAKQKAASGSPMLPNFADPDDEEMDDYRPDGEVAQDDEVEVEEDPDPLDEPYQVIGADG